MMVSPSEEAAVIPPLLSLVDVSIHFGGVIALAGVHFDVAPGEIVAVIGPNGAGKTTLFNCITGLYRCEGDVVFDGVHVERHAAYRRARMGMARTFQTPVLIDELSVVENVMLGANSMGIPGYFSSALRLNSRVESHLRRAAHDALDEAEMGEIADRLAGELPHGTRKSIELVRAGMSRPKLLLLDEPASGLEHDEAVDAARQIQRLSKAHGTAVIIVEHNMDLVMRLAQRIMVLDFGRPIAQGSPEEVRRSPEVQAAYLGGAV